MKAVDVRSAIVARKSVRAFTSEPVPLEVVERILEVARYAPSGGNTQPWHVAVVTGEVKRRIQGAMEERFRSGRRGHMEYDYYPKSWFPPYRERRRACGMQLYASLGIDREDRARQREQWAANYRSFDAPVTLYFFLDRRLGVGAFLDMGMFLQSVMLAALAEGLATCPQASQAEYPEIVKEALGYPEEMMLVCGMAMGYADRRHPINGYRTPRESVDHFTKFFGFEVEE